ncbi:MAG: acyl-CoA thioesterase [Deltaproteobacteria bacterium]|nr:acyl-CoA thioesterase [Deltaproteobacteria bacterium]
MGFQKQIKVRFSDTDPAGVMYFPRFLDSFHGVFEDWFDEDLKMPYRWMLEDTRVGFPTVSVDVDYRGPLRFGETMVVDLAVTAIGDKSFACTYRARLKGGDRVLVRAVMKTATVDLDKFKAIPIPPKLKQALESRLERPVRDLKRPALTGA